MRGVFCVTVAAWRSGRGHEIQPERPQPRHLSAQEAGKVPREFSLTHTKVRCGPAGPASAGEGSRCSRELLPRKGEREGEQTVAIGEKQEACFYDLHKDGGMFLFCGFLTVFSIFREESLKGPQRHTKKGTGGEQGSVSLHGEPVQQPGRGRAG